MIATLALALAVQSGQSVTLSRTNKVGEIQKYQVKSHLLIEQRQIGSETFLPIDYDIDYDATVEIKKDKVDGVVEARYLRPTMNITEGETSETPIKRSVEKVNLEWMIDLSPLNRILAVKDMTPKKPEPKKKDGRWMVKAGIAPARQDLIMSFVGELQRLAMFIGNAESSMDFQPKLPLFEVNKGDTWKDTVAYSPQKLKSKNNKTVMQRLDYVYTYDGTVEAGGAQVHRITANLVMNADMTQFLKDNIDAEEFNEIGLKEVNYHLKATILFDLDLKTMKTVKAAGTSEGGFKLVVTQYPEDPILEQKLKGRTSLKLLAK